MAEQRAAQPDVPDMFADLGSAPDEPRAKAPRNRRVLWIGLAVIVVVAGVSVPIARHFVGRAPAGLTVPQHVAGLTLDTSSDATSTADYLRTAFAAGVNMQTSVGAVYTEGGTTSTQSDEHSVIFVGGTAKGTDASLLTQMLNQLDDGTDGVTGLVTEAPGPLGGLMKCGLTTDTTSAATAADGEMAVCAFADSGDVGIALFPNRTIDQAADLMRQVRAGVQ